jgi:very-short-patch-repair endonuclease
MQGQTNHWILDHAVQRTLRARMTDAERCLWKRLRGCQVANAKFRRQHPFMDYVLDFVCLESRLVVEVDGSQHQGCARDQVRDQRLHQVGFRVLRFWSNAVLQETDAVVAVIYEALSTHTVADPIPTPALPLKGRELNPATGATIEAPLLPIPDATVDAPLLPLQEGGREGDGVVGPKPIPDATVDAPLLTLQGGGREGEGVVGPKPIPDATVEAPLLPLQGGGVEGDGVVPEKPPR